MKLGFSAWAMRELSVERQVEIVRDAGYAGIALVSGAGFGLDALECDAARRREIRGLLADAGLELTAVPGHANMLVDDADEARAAIERVMAGIDLAVDLADGATQPIAIAMGYGSPADYETDKHRLVDVFGKLAAHAASRGAIVALEPHVGQAMDQPEKVAWFIDAVGSPNFRLNLDNSHFECMGCNLDEYIPILVPYSVHTEVKDQRGRYPNHEFLVPGEGDFDYARYLAAMDRAGWRGWITVEISVMVQRRPGYDPAEVARRSFDTLTGASHAAGVALTTR
jgi:sugar phosphate isomerase/epimerase